MNTSRGIKILGMGSYKPEFVVNNADFSKFIETDDNWITSRTGIKQRRFNVESYGRCEANCSMSAKAAQRALESAGVNADEIDMIIAATATPDYFFPTLSCLVQNLIGAENACAIDVNAACTGFVNALDIARAYLAVGEYKKILVVAGEMLSNQIDFTDRATCVLFGDGAGAVVVEASDNQYVSFLGAKGESPNNPLLYCEVNNTHNNNVFKAETADEPELEPPPGFLRMDGKEVYKFAADIMPRAVNEVCERAGVSLSEIDLLIPHQANIRIIKAAMKSLDIPEERVYVNIENTGNISSACIPVCLDELSKANRLKSGDKVCMVAFGAGLTYGAIIMEI